ncbi:hypothetical protein BJX63DRAFT_400621 [Aspergillus granulosus]|uniref:Uncharacterized protein n=1 Tax=Aspergillus granulosus TaxID=176169 RepID=A0ABR4H6M0_9EURO
MWSRSRFAAEGNCFAFRLWPYNLTNTGFLLSLLHLYAPIFYISKYALERGMSSQMALYQVGILNAPSFFGARCPILRETRWAG